VLSTNRKEGELTAQFCDRFDALETEWPQFIERCEADHPFNTYSWLHTWWEHFGGAGCAIATVRQSGRLLCCIPTMLEGTGSKRRRRLWINTHSFRSGLLCDGDVPEAMGLAFDLIRGLKDWDSLTLYYLPTEYGVHQALKDQLEHIGVHYAVRQDMRSPRLEIQHSWSDYVDSLSGSRRQAERRKMRMLCEKLDARIEITTGRSQHLGEMLEDCWAVSRNSWKQAWGSAIGIDDRLMTFYEDIARRNRDWLVLGLVYLGEKPIAFEYNLLYKDTLYNLKLGFDEQHKEVSPGQVLRFKMLEWAFQANVKFFDFMGHEAEYKNRFSNCMMPHETIQIFGGSLSGRLMACYELSCKPLARRVRRVAKSNLKDAIS